MTQLHFKDLKRALYGEGNNRLFGKCKKYEIKSTIWMSLMKEQREKTFSNFLENKKFPKKTKLNLRIVILLYQHLRLLGNPDSALDQRHQRRKIILVPRKSLSGKQRNYERSYLLYLLTAMRTPKDITRL